MTSTYILLQIQLHLISLGLCSKINHYKKLMNRNHEYEIEFLSDCKETLFIHRFQCDGKTIEVLVMPAKSKRGLTFPQVNKF